MSSEPDLLDTPLASFASRTSRPPRTLSERLVIDDSKPWWYKWEAGVGSKKCCVFSWWILEPWCSCGAGDLLCLHDECSLKADVNLVFAGDGSRLVVTDVAVKSFMFQVVVVYAPNCFVERKSFFRRLGPFLTGPRWIVLVSDLNVILDPKLDRIGRGIRGSVRGDSSLIDLMVEHDMVYKFCLDLPGREMWTWLFNSPLFIPLRSYQDRV